MLNMNSGYSGWSMSKRAVNAYANGEKPKSKWTKKAMVEALRKWCEEHKRVYDERLAKLRRDELFAQFFRLSSWHHTSKYANVTDFYAVDDVAMIAACPLRDGVGYACYWCSTDEYGYPLEDIILANNGDGSYTCPSCGCTTWAPEEDLCYLVECDAT